MKVTIERADTSYKLSSAVLIYKSKSSGQAYASVHDVQEITGKPVIRPGVPLTEEGYLSLVGSLKPEDKPVVQWMDKSILAKGMDRVVWWKPPGTQPLFFKMSPAVEGTFTGHALCALPGLVFMVMNKRLFVYAFKGDQRPTPETQLHQAPFFNVWAKGEVCSGNAIKPEEANRLNPVEWEKFFFGSNFTHPNFREKDRLLLGVDPIKYWKKQLQNPRAKFPEKHLVGLNLKAGDLLALDLKTKLDAIRARGEF